MSRISLIVLLSLVLAACSKEKQNPLRGHKDVISAQPEGVIQDGGFQVSMVGDFGIEIGDLSFTAEHRKTVPVRVSVPPSTLEAGYHLEVSGAAAEAGLQVKKNSQGLHYLDWKPTDALIGDTETRAKVQLVLHIKTDDVNRDGQTLTKTFELSVTRDSSYPVIQTDKVYKPSPTLNPGDLGEVYFIVGAKNVTDARSALQVSTNGVSEGPKPELLQVNAALFSEPARFIKALGKTDEAGRALFQYSIRVNAEQVIARAYHLIEISKDPRMKSKYLSGEFRTIEAALSIHVQNLATRENSSSTMAVFNVNLDPKADEPFIGGQEVFKVQQNSIIEKDFNIASQFGRGTIEISSEVPDVQGATISLTCKSETRTSHLNQGCLSDNCLKKCTLQATTSCEVKPQVVRIPLLVQSTMYDDVYRKEMDVHLNIQANPKMCSGGEL